MYERFTDRARKVMQLANQEAQRLDNEYIGTEHILRGLVKEGGGAAADVLKNLDVDLRKILLEVEKLVQSGPDMVTMGKLPKTPRAKKVIEYSMEEARNLGHDYVGTEHLLLGLLRDDGGRAATVLMTLGLRLDDVRSEVLAVLHEPHSKHSHAYVPEPTAQKGKVDVVSRCFSENNRQLPEPDWKPQFSLRSMLVLTFAFAVWLSICRIVPHIAVFLLGIILAGGTTYSLVRLKRKVRGCRLRRLDRFAYAVLRTLTLLSWAYFYVVSIGPVIAVAEKAGITPNRPLGVFYFPVILLHDLTPLAKPLEAYLAAWRSATHPKVSWIDGVGEGLLGIMPRPRGGDCLDGEIQSLAKAGVNVVVSLLTADEVAELELQDEERLCGDCGLRLISLLRAGRDGADYLRLTSGWRTR